MTLRLYDTATRTLRDFVPLQPGKVGIYICGLTVQGSPHIGHVRFTVAFDILRRWLERGHGYEVTLIRNVTDIDDKILAKSAEAGQPWWAWAYAHERETADALEALGVLPPTYEPRATGHVPEMVELMTTLVDNGHAYPAADESGDVYFDVRSWPAYGELTHQALDDMAPAEDAEPRAKKDPRDFALWKGAKPDEPASATWSTPYGAGRPGWHLECSAMARKYLGDTFDIHGGGVDLRFPHHENEQAQSRAAGLGFARYWLHNGWLTLGGEKMSKSLGNSMIVSHLLQHVRPVVLRYFLGSTHYRSTLEYHEDSLREAEAALDRIEGFLRRAAPPAGGFAFVIDYPRDFVEALDDDLNVSGALAVVHETVTAGNKAIDEGDDDAARTAFQQVVAMTDVLGINPIDSRWNAGGGPDDATSDALASLVEAELAARQQARATRDYATADAVRDRLAEAGIEVEDTPAGPRWSVARPPALERGESSSADNGEPPDRDDLRDGAEEDS
ncbi:MAG TPA: cysteine--tRNA ligase [Actinomycetales bacterium]|nr:cysteine--tRNA ligase [Actinomycetales bacterium]